MWSFFSDQEGDNEEKQSLIGRKKMKPLLTKMDPYDPFAESADSDHTEAKSSRRWILDPSPDPSEKRSAKKDRSGYRRSESTPNRMLCGFVEIDNRKSRFEEARRPLNAHAVKQYLRTRSNSRGPPSETAQSNGESSQNSMPGDPELAGSFATERIALAARFVQLALQRRDILRAQDVLEDESQLAKVLLSFWYQSIMVIVIVCHLSMILWECGALWFSLFFKGAIISFYISDVLLHWKAFGVHYFIDKKWSMVFVAAALFQVTLFSIHLVEVILSGIEAECLFVGLSQVVRPYLLVAKVAPLRQPLSTFLRTLTNVIALLLLALVIITFYAVMATVLFNDIQCPGYNSKGDNFNTFGPAVLSMYILTTTENFPFVAEPALQQRPLWGYPYFFSFVCIFVLILLPLLLAQVLNTYRENHAERFRRSLTKARKGLLAAYYIATVDEEMESLGMESSSGSQKEQISHKIQAYLKANTPYARERNESFPESEYQRSFSMSSFDKEDDPAAIMSFSRFTAVVQKVNPSIQTEVIEALLKLIDADWERKLVSPKSFIRLTDYVDERLLEEIPEVPAKGIGRWQRICDRLVRSWYFQPLSQILTLGLVCMSLIWQQSNLNLLEMCRLGTQAGDVCKVVSVQVGVERTLIILYAIEVTIRWRADKKGYLHGRGMGNWNKIDIGLLMMCLLAEVMSEVTLLFAYPEWRLQLFDIWELPRAMRVLRLIIVFETFRNLVDSITPCLQIIGELLMLYFCISYSFAAIGMYLFGHVDNSTNHSPNSVDPALFLRYNFQNFGGAMMSLLYLSVSNNWDDLLYHNINQTSEAYAFYFVSYMVFCSTILLDIIVGVVMAAYAAAERHKEENLDTGFKYRLKVSASTMFLNDTQMDVSREEMRNLENAIQGIEKKIMKATSDLTPKGATRKAPKKNLPSPYSFGAPKFDNF